MKQSAAKNAGTIAIDRGFQLPFNKLRKPLLSTNIPIQKAQIDILMKDKYSFPF